MRILLQKRDKIDVRVKVTLNEPANKAVYDKIANGRLSIKLTFSITQ